LPRERERKWHRSLGTGSNLARSGSKTHGLKVPAGIEAIQKGPGSKEEVEHCAAKTVAGFSRFAITRLLAPVWLPVAIIQM
jgi:hypothetical protein